MYRTAAAFAFVAALGITGRSDRGPRPRLDGEAREYVRLAVALGERDPDALDFYIGPPDLVADIRTHPPALHAIKNAAEAAVSRLELRGVPAGERPRRDRLQRELTALAVRAGLLLGDRRTYDDESRLLFGIAPWPEDRRVSELRARVDALIPGPGRLTDRYAAYDARFIVPADRLATVFEHALAECRARTRAHVQLPADERVSVEFVGNRPWSAYSRYLGRGRSVVSVNRDFRFTVDRVLQTACHEAYPGHHVRNTLVERMSAGSLPELMVQPLFSPRMLVGEGSAMYAPEVAFADGDRVAFERDQLFPVAGIGREDAEKYVRVGRLVDELQDVQLEIARRYLDGRLEFARAATALEEQALMHESGAMLKYVNQYRSYVTAYTVGRKAAKSFVEGCAGAGARDRRWQCFEHLLTADDYSIFEKSIDGRAMSAPSR
jgi:hypothetical protein